MKITFFDDFRLGIVKNDAIVDVTHVATGYPTSGPHDLISGLIERFDQFKPKLEQAAASGKSVSRCRAASTVFRV